MSGGGWQEGEQGLPGLPGGHQGQGRGGSPPFSSDHGQGDIHRGRGTYSEGQGDIQRFLEDVEASGKPRCVFHLVPNIIISHLLKFSLQSLNTFAISQLWRI